jgi:hypothetical protein
MASRDLASHCTSTETFFPQPVADATSTMFTIMYLIERMERAIAVGVPWR